MTKITYNTMNLVLSDFPKNKNQITSIIKSTLRESNEHCTVSYTPPLKQEQTYFTLFPVILHKKN